jgi:hypothetical protein
MVNRAEVSPRRCLAGAVPSGTLRATSPATPTSLGPHGCRRLGARRWSLVAWWAASQLLYRDSSSPEAETRWGGQCQVAGEGSSRSPEAETRWGGQFQVAGEGSSRSPGRGFPVLSPAPKVSPFCWNDWPLLIRGEIAHICAQYSQM